MSFLLGFIPTVRGLIMLAIAAGIGGWVGGNRGATSAAVIVTALAFLKPNISMWIESVLFAVRGACYAMAGFRLLLAFGPIGASQSTLTQAAVFGSIGAIAHFRIWWLVRRGELCPLALGTRTR